MRIVRYEAENGSVGHAAEQPEGALLRIDGDILDDYRVTDEPVIAKKLLAPIVPAAILCIGLNYKHHAEETNAKIPDYPILFLKGPNTLAGPGEPIRIPTALRSEKVDYEAELTVVIGKTCKNVSRANALDYVLGYTCGNDVSARDWQMERSGGQWSRGKSFDTFCPLGPAIVTTDEIPTPNALRIRTVVEDETLQDWNTSDMIFHVPALIEFLSGSTTLLAGTVILTGTPQGVGMGRKPPRFLQPGETVTVEIEKIGQLTNPVARE
jgi:2-keto-4-pentenoate hydratase/2-oxohepta-3-ene-1,7-dioic acid hydratase in catechol pathway